MINLSAIKPTQLKSALSSTAIQIRVKEFATRLGDLPDFADLDTDWFVVVIKQGDQWEQIKIDGFTQETDGSATLDIATNGRNILPISPYTGSSTGFDFGVVAEVILTNDMLTMSQFAKLSNNNAFTGYNTVPNPISAQGVVPRDYMLSLINGGAISVDSVIQTGIAGETITAGQLVYLKVSDGRWWLTDADTASTVENVVLGIAQGAGTAGNSISGGVMTQGTDTHQTGLTINTKYYASNTAGGISATAGTKEVSIGIALSATDIFFYPRFDQDITEDEQDAMAGGSTFGTPSATNKFITQDYNSSATGLPVIQKYVSASAVSGSSTTQFDITNPSGTTFRYTYDGTGTDPVINGTTYPVGALVSIQCQNFNSSNNGIFSVTGSGSNYFEITNASGVVESNKTIGTGYLVVSSETWTKPTGLKYIVLEVQGAGGGGGGVAASGGAARYVAGGGGGGGYMKSIIQASSLNSSYALIIGGGGTGGAGSTNSSGTVGRISAFSPTLYSNGGGGGVGSSNATGGIGGTAGGGDIRISGGNGGSGGQTNSGDGSGATAYGVGAGAFLAPNTIGTTIGSVATGASGSSYGGGGAGGADSNSGAGDGGAGANGIIIITEYYS